jgi:hypothetical protein
MSYDPTIYLGSAAHYRYGRPAYSLLANRSPEGIFWDWPGDTEVVLARKPSG